MTLLYLWALLAIALSLCVLMALAWVVQQRTGNSGWVDTIAYQSRTSKFFPLRAKKGVAT
jgi:steroid 5-alpha reductase family enzyme